MLKWIGRLLMALACVVILIAAFRQHWAVGLLAVAALVGVGWVAARAALYSFRGNAAYANDKLQEALGLMEKAYRIKPSHPQHRVGYAYMLLRTGEPEKAEQLLQPLAIGLPDGIMQMQARINRATACWLQGRRDEAVRNLEETLEKYKNTTVYGNLGYMLLLQGDAAAARPIVEEALEYNDNDVTILDNAAYCHLLLGEWDEAADMYAKVEALKPKNAESYYYYALALERLGRTEEARERAETAQTKPLALITNVTKDDIAQLAQRLGAAGAADAGVSSADAPA